MNYARWSEGDVYFYSNVTGGFTCLWCRIHADLLDAMEAPDDEYTDFWDWRGATHAEAIAHIEDHVSRGHDVPPRCLDRLRQEVANGEADLRIRPLLPSSR